MPRLLVSALRLRSAERLHVHDAQDLTQEFFARLLARNYLSVADRNKGKFRSFLLGSLEHFLAREWTKAHAQKRGGGRFPSFAR